MLRAISKRFWSASRLIDHLSIVSFILAQVDTWWFLHMCVHVSTYTHTHTLSLSLSQSHKSTQIFHCGSSLVSPSVSFPVLKPSIWVDSPSLYIGHPFHPLVLWSVYFLTMWMRQPEPPVQFLGFCPPGSPASALLLSTYAAPYPESLFMGHCFPTPHIFSSETL